MIRLFQLPPAYGLPNASPFCLKLETFLRMAGQAYQNVYIFNPGKAPKGKLPYIEDEGRAVADSGLILGYLKEHRNLDLDASLTPAERAVSLAWQRLLEEHLYWALIHSRWLDEDGWRRTRQEFFGKLPWPLRALVPALVRRGMRAEIRGHGMGRHKADEIWRMGMTDLEALSDFLADKPYFMGGHPSSLDAVAYGFLANILLVDLDNPLRRRALQLPNLGAFCERMKGRYWGEGST